MLPLSGSDGKFRSFYQLRSLSLVQQNEQIFFGVISFFLAKHNSKHTYLTHLLLMQNFNAIRNRKY